ncbi:MAG: hypothetical protein ACI80V_000630 [Rhodothermales bacterium]|jgi:hypothetical protein
MHLKSACFFLLVLSLGSPAAAQPIDATVFSVTTLDPTARGAALGGAAAALPSAGILAFLENPAHLTPDVHNEFGISLLNHVSSLKTGTFAFGRNYESAGSFGVAVRFLGWGDLTRADASGQELGTFSAGEFAMSLGGSRPLTALSRYGASIHWLRSGIDGQSANALALDLGVFRYNPDQRLGLSASIHQLGFVASSIGQTDDKLPLDVRLGVSKRLRHLPLLVSVTAWDLTDFSSDSETDTVLDNLLYHLKLGGEFQFSDSFQVRFGYDHRRHAALKTKTRLDLAGASFGLGIKVKRVVVDYAFSSWSSQGGLHRFTVSTKI